MAFIDADTHVHEPEQAWSYLDAAHADLRPVPIVTDDEGQRRFWWIADQVVPRGPRRQLNEGGGVEPAAKDLSDVALRVAWMDRLGVDYQVVLPTFFLIAILRQPEVELALAQSYNRFMADKWEESGRRLYWTMIPALGSLDATRAMMREAREHGACAVFVRGLEQDRALPDRYFDPLYATAQELDMAVTVHVGNVLPAVTARDTATFFGVTPVIAAFYDLLVSDVPDRFPALRFGFLEASAAWLPFALDRASRRLSASEHPDPLHREILEEKRFVVAAMATEDLPYLIGHVGAGCLVLGTDFGHSDIGTEIRAHEEISGRPDVSGAEKKGRPRFERPSPLRAATLTLRNGVPSPTRRGRRDA